MRFILKWAIGFLLVLLLAFLCHHLNYSQVIILLNGYRLDMTLPSLLILIVVVLVLGHLLLRFYASIIGFPKKFSRWREERRAKKDFKLLFLGLLNYFAGQYDKVEKYLNRVSQDDQSLQVMVRILAKKNRIIDDHEQSNLRILPKSVSKIVTIAETLTAARNYYELGEFANCIDRLQLLDGSKNIVARRLLLKSYLGLGKYVEGYNELGMLVKLNGLSSGMISQYRSHIITKILDTCLDATEVEKFFAKLPSDDKNLFINPYIQALLRLGQVQTAAIMMIKDKYNIVYETLGRELTAIAMQLNETKMLEKIVDKCHDLGEDVNLSLAIGIIHYKLGNAQIARDFLEKSASKSRLAYLYILLLALDNNEPSLIAQAKAELLTLNRSGV